MSEQELKLHVPPKSRDNIKKAFNHAKSMPLRALYFDTTDRQLAKAKAAIRLRKEGDHWVQTLKIAGPNSLSRIEFNHPCTDPILDLGLYAGTEAESFIAKLTKPLELRYETDVVRLFKKQRTRKGTVEIAFDTGVIRTDRFELPVHEVEFERVSGHIQAIFDVGLRWINDYQLILDMRSKAQRGDALANMCAKVTEADEDSKLSVEMQETARFWAERKAKSYSLPNPSDATQTLCRLTEECVEQISLNAAYLAEVDTADIMTIATPAHVRQVCVGICRLLSNWKLFSPHTPLPHKAIQQLFKTFLADFGATHDTDVMATLPLLIKAGMPTVEAIRHQGRSATEIACDPTFQTLLVKLLEWVATAPTQAPVMDGVSDAQPPHLSKTLEKRLNKWSKSIVKHWKHPKKNDIPSYRDIHSKIKRMRYGLNVYEALEPQANLNGYMKQLTKTQKILDTLNDYASALDYFKSLTPAYPQAWFAVGWLSAQLKHLTRAANAALKTLPSKIDA